MSELRDHLVDAGYDELLLADGFDEAFLGVVSRGTDVACYSRTKCLAILCERDGLTWEEAVEHFDFNVSGAWVGMQTPLFLDDGFLPTGLHYELQVSSVGVNIKRRG